MKKILRLIPLLCLIISLVIPYETAMASPTEERTIITITASVPSDFNAELTVSFENTITLIRKAVILNKDNGYSSEIRLFSDNTYKTYVYFSDYGDWKTDIKEQYEIGKGTLELHINVKSGDVIDNVYENDGTVEPDIDLGEDYDADTYLLKGKIVMERFLDAVSCMKNNAEYESFLKIYGADKIKEYYIKAHENNTEERWEAMTNFERFVWRVGYNQPHLYLFKVETQDEYIDNAIAVEKNKLKAYNFENSDEIYDALVELCKWQYDYFLVTGNVYDYYNGSDDDFSQLENKEENILSSENSNIITENEDTEEAPQENGFIEFLKKSWITLILVVVIGVAFVYVKEKNRKANIYDESDK